MKRVYSALLILLMLLTVLCTAVSASDGNITVTNDYETLTVYGTGYTLFNYNLLSADSITGKDFVGETVTTTGDGADKIASVTIRNNPEKTILRFSYTYENGIELTLYYLRNDCLAEYECIVGGKAENLTLNFESWTENDDYTVQNSALTGETVTLYSASLSFANYTTVSAYSTDGSYSMMYGCIFTKNGEYFYADAAEAGMEMPYSFNAYREISSFPAHRITDKALIAVLEDHFTEVDYGTLYEDDTSNSISLGFFVFVFGVIPFTLCVLFLALAIPAKGEYRRLYGIIAVLSAATLSVFFTILALILLLG